MGVVGILGKKIGMTQVFDEKGDVPCARPGRGQTPWYQKDSCHQYKKRRRIEKKEGLSPSSKAKGLFLNISK